MRLEAILYHSGQVQPHRDAVAPTSPAQDQLNHRQFKLLVAKEIKNQKTQNKRKHCIAKAAFLEVVVRDFRKVLARTIRLFYLPTP